MLHPIANLEFEYRLVVESAQHGLSTGDQVCLFDIQTKRGFGIPRQLWTVRRETDDTFSLDGSSFLSQERYVGGGEWYRYERGTAPHAGSRAMTLDGLGNLLEANDGGIYRRTDTWGDLGVWSSRNGNLQITPFHDVDWDHHFQRIVGSAMDIGVSAQESTGSRR